MSDERNEQETYRPIHELSETPFGAASSQHEAPASSEPAAAREDPKPEPQEDPKPQEDEEVGEEICMETAMAAMGSGGVDYSGTFRSLSVGQVVDGVVVHIDREGVLVDVGTKSEGTVKLTELTRDPNVNPEDVVAVGDKIKVYVVESESHEGGPVLSKKRADFENAWDRVEHALASGGVIKAMVNDRVKGGLVVDLGIRGFVPASHVGSGKLKNLDKFVGQSMAFKVIEVDRERRKVVLSNRLAAEEEQGKLKQETVASLAEGQIREGVVRRITEYGAFVDLGGVDGLLHISEMSGGPESTIPGRSSLSARGSGNGAQARSAARQSLAGFEADIARPVGGCQAHPSRGRSHHRKRKPAGPVRGVRAGRGRGRRDHSQLGTCRQARQQPRRRGLRRPGSSGQGDRFAPRRAPG